MSHIHPVQLAYFEEATQGTPPADASAWVSDGVRVQVLSGSIAAENLKPAAVEDMRSQVHIHDIEDMVEGLRNVDTAYQVYLTGTGLTAAAGAQAVETPLAAQLRFALGGVHRSNSTVCDASGNDANTINAVADTNFAVGGHIAWQHPTTGLLYIRRLVLNSSANLWNLDQDLPQAAASGDVIHGCVTIYPDMSVLGNSNGSGGPFTQSWWLAFGDDSPILERYVLMGAVSELGTLDFPRGDTPKANLTIKAANFIANSAESVPTPSWVDPPDGEAPGVIGPDTEIFLQTYGTTTNAGYCTASASITPGVPRLATETITELSANMQGICSWHTGRAEALADIVLAPFAEYPIAAWAAHTKLVFRIAKLGLVGNAFAVTMPRCEVKERPVRVNATNEQSGRSFQLRAHRDTTTIGTTELARARMAIVLA